MTKDIGKMSIKEIDAEIERMERQTTGNPLRKVHTSNASEQIQKLARALMQLGYLGDGPSDKTLVQVAKVLGIDTTSIEPKTKSRTVSKASQNDILLAGERASNAVMLRALRTNPDVLATASIKDIDEAMGNGPLRGKRPW